MSLYADNAAVFIKPTRRDWITVRAILQFFADASGLITNMQKTQIFPIRCQEIDLTCILGNDQNISQFPCTYLGLPLHVKKLPKALIQLLVQKIGARLPGWKRKLMTYPGREVLVKSVLSSMPTYFLTVFRLPKWAEKQIDKYQRSFLWRGQDPDNIKGGRCLVNWKTCLRPKRLGGLGIKDLDKFGRALRLRWLWHIWDPCARPWKLLFKTKDQIDRQLFFASTEVALSNGTNTPFWEARWLHGASPKELAPGLYSQARFKHRTVAKELMNRNWIRNLGQLDTEELLSQFIMLFNLLREVQLNEEPDRITWRWTANGEYSASSAYNAQFIGASIPFNANKIWMAKTEAKCKFFAWLALHGKTLTADNLAKKNWPHQENCSLCYCLPETTEHLLTQCNFTEAVWHKVIDILHLQQEIRNLDTQGVIQCLDKITHAGTKKDAISKSWNLKFLLVEHLERTKPKNISATRTIIPTGGAIDGGQHQNIQKSHVLAAD